MRMAVSQSPGRRSRVLGAPILHTLSGESPYHSRLPCPPSTLCAQLARGRGFYLWRVALSRVPKPADSCCALLHRSSQRRKEEVSPELPPVGSPLEVRQPYMNCKS